MNNALSLIRGLNKNLVRVALALMLWGIGEGMFYLFLTLYLQEWGADPVMIGMAVSAIGIAMALSFLPAGYLSDRFGPKPVMLAGWGIALAATIIMAFAPSLPVFIAGLIFYGLTSFINTPIMAYASRMRGNLEVGRVMTLTSAGFQLGMIIGPLLGGVIATHFGLVMNYRLAILIFIVSSAVIFFVDPLPPVGEHHDTEKTETVWRNGKYLIFVGLFLFTVIILYMPQLLTPNYLQSVKGMSLESYGQLASIGSFGVVLFALVFGGLQPGSAFLLGQVFVSLFVILMWKGEGQLAFSIGYFFVAGYRLTATMSMAFVKSLVRTSQLGLAFGLLSTAQSVAVILSPLLAGFLYDLEPEMIYKVALIGIAVIFLVNNLVMPRLKSGFHRPAETNPPAMEKNVSVD